MRSSLPIPISNERTGGGRGWGGGAPPNQRPPRVDSSRLPFLRSYADVPSNVCARAYVRVRVRVRGDMSSFLKQARGGSSGAGS